MLTCLEPNFSVFPHKFPEAEKWGARKGHFSKECSAVGGSCSHLETSPTPATRAKVSEVLQRQGGAAPPSQSHSRCRLAVSTAPLLSNRFTYFDPDSTQNQLAILSGLPARRLPPILKMAHQPQAQARGRGAGPRTYASLPLSGGGAAAMEGGGGGGSSGGYAGRRR